MADKDQVTASAPGEQVHGEQSPRPGDQQCSSVLAERALIGFIVDGYRFGARAGADRQLHQDAAWREFRGAAAARDDAEREIGLYIGCPHAAGIGRDQIEIHAGRRRRMTTDAEAAPARVGVYKEIATDTHDLWNRIKREVPIEGAGASGLRSVRSVPARARRHGESGGDAPGDDAGQGGRRAAEGSP
jgi:hypothetical protein